MEQTQTPTATQEPLTFGRYLKKIRLDKGLAIENIMDETRMSKYVIQQIEAENIGNLPEDVYLKGFLKAYAEAVGVDPYDVLEKYNIACEQKQGQLSHAKREGHGAISRISMKFLVFTVVIVLGIVFLIVYYRSNTFTGNHSDADTVAATDVDAAVPGATPEGVTDVKPQPTAAEGGLHLAVICLEATTLKITADGGLPEEFNLQPEDHIELKAEKMYTIMIDNTCGVSMLLNNNPVTVPGKCGQTATIQLP